jgi:predicted XRE-type DNA-binding protein
MNADSPGLVEREFNPQTFLNTLLGSEECAEAASDYENDPDRLHNDSRPNLGIKREKPEHRIILWLKAQGKSNKEIAELTGNTQPWVSQILRQPWARQRVLQIIKENGLDEVQSLLQSTTIDSIYTLIEVRDSAQAKPSERTAAANALLDRALGKPVVSVVTDNKHTQVPVEAARLNAELDAINTELKRFGLSN